MKVCIKKQRCVVRGTYVNELVSVVSKRHHETIVIDAGSLVSESSSARTSSDTSSNDPKPARPQSQDLHESRPSQ